MLHLDSFLLLALPTLPNRNIFIKWLITPSPAASQPLIHVSSLKARFHFLAEVSLPLTHFALSSLEQAFCILTSFPVAGLASLGMKPRFCRSSWRAFASTHSLMFSHTFSSKVLFAYLHSPFQNLFFFTVESILSFPCSCADLPFIKVWLSLILTVSHLTICSVFFL